MLGISRRGYNSWLNRPLLRHTLANQVLLKKIRHIFYAHREVYGAPRIHHVLQDEGVVCGLNRVARLMQQATLVPKTMKKFRLTTDSRKSCYPAKNLLGRRFSVTRPNRIWVADVTYIPTRAGWLFLVIVLDLYSRKVVGCQWEID